MATNFMNFSTTDVVRLKIVGKTGSSITLPAQPTNPTAHLDGSTLTMCLAARTPSTISCDGALSSTSEITLTGSFYVEIDGVLVNTTALTGTDLQALLAQYNVQMTITVP